jgi:hypothetical protein
MPEQTDSASQAEKRQKTDAVQKEAKSSKKSQSDAKNDIQPVGETPTGAEAQKVREETEKNQKEASLKAASGKGTNRVKESKEAQKSAGAHYELPEGYDPYADPVVTSSATAQVVAKELRGLGESPTLQALHEGAGNTKKNTVQVQEDDNE